MQSQFLRSIVVAANGGPSALQLQSTPLEPFAASLAADEVLVKTSFVGINFIDTYHRSGLYPPPRPFPFTLGSEASGSIVGVGSGVDTSKVGSRVAFFTTSTGAYANYVKVKALDAFPVPDGVGDDVAAAVMLQGCTAHYLCHSCRDVSKKDTVLVHASAGGTGLLLSQLCKAKGATVIGTCGSDAKVELSTTVGRCDHVINYTTTPEWWTEVRKLAPSGVDAVFDGVGSTTFLKSLEVLKPRGDMISFGNASGAVDPIAPLLLTKYGSLRLQRPKLGDFASHEGGEIEGRVADLFRLMSEGRLAVTIGRTFALEEAAAAHEYLEGRGSTGKVLLRVADGDQ